MCKAESKPKMQKKLLYSLVYITESYYFVYGNSECLGILIGKTGFDNSKFNKTFEIVAKKLLATLTACDVMKMYT